mmetsp:Transcript_153993/g.266704  ORF Transcript_153993/g.266704 Transcript_153993/m.266704 type:complete len:90 (+) Transcript_153993:75-344(+)
MVPLQDKAKNDERKLLSVHGKKKTYNNSITIYTLHVQSVHLKMSNWYLALSRPRLLVHVWKVRLKQLAQKPRSQQTTIACRQSFAAIWH